MQLRVALGEWHKVNELSTPLHTNSRKRPGGRTADVTARIHKAVRELIEEGGLEACTFAAVAKRAGVERSTLYRRYPDRWDTIIDAWLAGAAEGSTPELGSTFAEDLTSVLRRIAEVLGTPAGPAVLRVAAELRTKPDGEVYMRTYLKGRLEQLAPMFDAAITRGELPANVDREAVLTSAAGPVYFRIFIAGRPVDEDFIRTVVSSICWLHCPPSVAAKLSLPARIA
jgi:AcrR family transcriptional regulator